MASQRGNAAAEQRASIIKQYRELDEVMETRRDEIVDPNSTLFDENTKKINDAMAKMESGGADIKGGTLRLDAQISMQHAKLGAIRAENTLQMESKISPEEIIQKLLHKFKKGNSLSWELFGTNAILKGITGIVPEIDSFQGRLALATTQRKQSKPRVRQEKIVAPLEIAKVSNPVLDTKGKVKKKKDANMARIKKIMTNFNEKGSLPYLPSLTDPSSFSHTIENIFHSTFLVKEGYAKLHSQGGGVTWEIDRKNNEDDDMDIGGDTTTNNNNNNNSNTNNNNNNNNNNNKTQAILKFDMDVYNAILKSYDAKVFTLPPWSLQQDDEQH